VSEDLAFILRGIREANGKLTPKLVLDEARHHDHPLHGRFEWDDAIASEAWRLQQARELIRTVRVSFTNQKGTEVSVRRYYAIRVADADEYDYDDIEEALRDSFRRKLLLNEMQRRIDELIRQFGALQEFWEVLRKVTRQATG
jgi:hypothetical protein